MRRFILFVFVITSLSSFGQRTVNVNNVRGMYIGSDNETPNIVKEKALNNAKINALSKAGIPEDISSYNLLYQLDKNGDFQQIFDTQFQSEIKGAVKSYEIINENRDVNEFGNFEIEITINAKVIKYNKNSDPSFTSKINGIKPVYNHGADLEFDLISSQDFYLTIFYFNDNEAGLLFPNPREESKVFNAEKIHNFPYNARYELITEKKEETNRLIFVFTKEDYKFITKNPERLSSRDEIFEWIYSISPDRRTTNGFSFTILKNN